MCGIASAIDRDGNAASWFFVLARRGRLKSMPDPNRRKQALKMHLLVPFAAAVTGEKRENAPGSLLDVVVFPRRALCSSALLRMTGLFLIFL